jgi:hypothetical protein
MQDLGGVPRANCVTTDPKHRNANRPVQASPMADGFRSKDPAATTRTLEREHLGDFGAHQRGRQFADA